MAHDSNDLRARARLAFGLIAAALGVVIACWAWGASMPALGERPFSSARIWTARCGAATLWAAAHAILFGLAIPSIYRPRPIYLGATAVFGLIATLSAVTAAALFAATGR